MSQRISQLAEQLKEAEWPNATVEREEADIDLALKALRETLENNKPGLKMLAWLEMLIQPMRDARTGRGD